MPEQTTRRDWAAWANERWPEISDDPRPESKVYRTILSVLEAHMEAGGGLASEYDCENVATEIWARLALNHLPAA